MHVSSKTKIIAADPAGSIIYDAVKKGSFEYKGGSWLVEGIGEDFIPDILDLSYVDDAVTIPDSIAFETLDILLKKCLRIIHRLPNTTKTNNRQTVIYIYIYIPLIFYFGHSLV